jgi:hypothetical protein
MPFYYFIILYIIPFLIFNHFAMKVGRQFGRLYKERRDPKAVFAPEEVNEKYMRKPRLFWYDAPKLLTQSLEIFWRDYQDEELNKLARKLSLYFLAQILLIMFNFLFFAYYIGRNN